MPKDTETTTLLRLGLHLKSDISAALQNPVRLVTWRARNYGEAREKGRLVVQRVENARSEMTATEVFCITIYALIGLAVLVFEKCGK